MRIQTPILLPIFRSDLQANLLLRVLTSDEGLTAADLARDLEEPEPTVFREPRLLLGRALAGIAGINAACLHGSYASRFHGEERWRSADDVTADLPLCRAIVDMAIRIVDQKPPH